MFSQKIIFIFIFEYPLRIISELIKILVDTLINYYTDGHDVDEDMRSILAQGGMWTEGSATGVTDRTMFDGQNESSTYVASMKNIGHSR